MSHTVVDSSLKVFCRFRVLPKTDIPFEYSTDGISVSFKLKNDENLSKTTYRFDRIFDVNSSQKDIFNACCLQSIENLFFGEDSLIFLYGVTGSGKTYTMNGTTADPGVLPYSINYLFNSIAPEKFRKNLVHSDGHNGFALKQSGPLKDQMDVVPTAEYNTVFVSYIEIYNNSVFDLLDEELDVRKGNSSKTIREDKLHRCYVMNAIEIEVGNFNEAMNILAKGNKRRKMCETSLNISSSRSHVIFILKFVRILAGDVTSNIISFVDLAGSERAGRTMNKGVRLREAGCINNSLMALRSCIECLRDNQRNGEQKLVPYRNSKLTHLFKYYFDGNGAVNMLVCCKPAVSDFDENIKVMQFAEMAKEVEIKKPIREGSCIYCNRFCKCISRMEIEISAKVITSMMDVDRALADMEKFIVVLKPICDEFEESVDKGERNVLPSVIAAREKKARLVATPVRTGQLMSKTPARTNRERVLNMRNAASSNAKRTRFIL